MDKQQPYNPLEIEPKWQAIWEEEKIYQAQDFSDKPKKYILIEFPYASGEGLHVGHCRPYTALDIVARKSRMDGHNVLFPFGWDAFGLPTENYAIKHGINPTQVTAKNTANFKKQAQRVGFSFDWSREIDTSKPEYYQWTQWIFLQLYKAGLAYKKKMPINWCPSCKIGLANEEVISGNCERCGTPTTKRELSQWMLKITAYADKLLEGLKEVDYLPAIKEQQINWIGRSEGASIQFPIHDFSLTGPNCCRQFSIEVFTTRADTLFGVTFLVLAPEHELINQITTSEQKKEVEKYVNLALVKSNIERQENKEKTGVFTGSYAINPINNEKIPIWVADYVLADYGTGAIMAVPSHDQRDYDFAQKYNLPIKEVIKHNDGNSSLQDSQIFSGQGIAYNSGEFSGLESSLAAEKIITWLEEKKLGHKQVNYNLRDWVFSRQHYWGEPIPIVYCEHCKNTKQKALLIHGFEGSGNNHWFPWIKKQLEQAGFEVFTPDLPDPSHPDLKQWLATLQPIISNFGPQDIIIGHSLGSKAALHLLAANNIHIKHLFLVASAISEISQRDWSSLATKLANSDLNALQKFWQEPIDLHLVDQLAATVSLVISDDDPLIPLHSRQDILPGWNLAVWSKQGHFTQSEHSQLLDWIMSAKNDGLVPLPISDLPLVLPPVENYQPTDTGESPLAAITDWVETTCPVCGHSAKRETDTMPNWAGSSWYYLRYCDPHNNRSFADFAKLQYWSPVDLYNGGMEHVTLHLLYSRFWHKFLYDQGFVPTPEPYFQRIAHGMVLGEGGVKMSKSKGNVINPMDVINEYGADTLRGYEMFMGPYPDAIPWDTNGVKGVNRFMYKLWNLAQEIILVNEKIIETPEQWLYSSAEIRETGLATLVHKNIKHITELYGKMSFNTVVSNLMIFLNDLIDQKTTFPPATDPVAWRQALEAFILLLSPICPHITEEIWQNLGHKQSITITPWPQYNPDLTTEELLTIPVQVNGKRRSEIILPASTDQAEIINQAKATPEVAKFLVDKTIVKEIYVPGKIVNLVVK